jgi:hypothetical protein
MIIKSTKKLKLVQFMFSTHFGAFGLKVLLALKIMNFENVF